MRKIKWRILIEDVAKDKGQELANKTATVRHIIEVIYGNFFNIDDLIKEAKTNIDTFIEKYKYQAGLSVAYYG